MNGTRHACQSYLGAHCSADVLQDMLAAFSEECHHHQVNSKQGRDGCIGLLSSSRSPPVAVSAIFSICKHLKLNHHVRYTAVEIYDRFMTKHIMDVVHDIGKHCEKEDYMFKWSETRETLTKQIWLRLITSITLAFKTYNASLVESRKLADSCVEFLRDFCGYRCTVTVLRKAEVRALATLDYKLIFPMPISCLQVLLAVLSHNLTSLKAAAFYPAVYEVLDLFYMKRITARSILEKRWLRCRHSVLDKKSLEQLIQGTNLVLISCAILAVVAFVSFTEDVLNQVVSEMEYITDLPLHDILDLRDMFLLQLFK
ncbi:hypothetical protein HDE_09972 [Halotydeus destructor]|nr:hypothetical protein HDE_09972 [Halotydeus destructor]